MTGLIVRLMDARDVEAFRRIRLESLRAAPEAFASSAADWEAFSDTEWRRRLTETRVFAAFVAGAPVGIMGMIRERGAKSAHRGSVVMVYVRDVFRQQGVSAALLRAVIDDARLCGLRQLELVVSAENPTAVNFYRRHGFAEIGRIPGGYLIEDREIDEIMMARRIDA